MLLPVGTQRLFSHERPGLEPEIVHRLVFDLQQHGTSLCFDTGNLVTAANSLKALLRSRLLGKALPADSLQILKPRGYLSGLALGLAQVDRVHLGQGALDIIRAQLERELRAQRVELAAQPCALGRLLQLSTDLLKLLDAKKDVISLLRASSKARSWWRE